MEITNAKALVSALAVGIGTTTGKCLPDNSISSRLLPEVTND